MKLTSKNRQNLFITGLIFGLLITACEEDNAITDAQKLAALENVTISIDGMDYEIFLPEGALSGESFEELMKKDSAKFVDPANYSINITVNNIADNTDDDARDAKFDGMYIDLVMDTISSNPIRTEAEGFEIEANTTQEVPAHGSINLETHKQAGLYIFQQTVDGNDLTTTFAPVMLYELGTLEGDIKLPSVTRDIPTRASEETKAFLRDLLESGVLEE